MSLSLDERILVPGIERSCFAAMSWGSAMSTVGGSTARMRTVALCASFFMTGFGYSVFGRQARCGDGMDANMDGLGCADRSTFSFARRALLKRVAKSSERSAKLNQIVSGLRTARKRRLRQLRGELAPIRAFRGSDLAGAGILVIFILWTSFLAMPAEVLRKPSM